MYRIIASPIFVVALFVVITVVVFSELMGVTKNGNGDFLRAKELDSTWIAPSLFVDHVTNGEEREMVIYGQTLIAQTSKYLGPEGIVLRTSNGMNCQNCHLDAGTKPWGNNYGAVYATYPKFRPRSGTKEDMYKRVNDCFQRSLNGRPLDTSTYEMQAIYAYLKWLGQNVPKGKKPLGSGLPLLPFMDKAADPTRGKAVYITYCQSCHGVDGEGQPDDDGSTFVTPPLWGKSSYNDGAGLYRISRFASFVKYNMPYRQASYTSPILSDEEAWDVAAFVNSQPRPHIDQSRDWPDITTKAVDEPFGPYADGFSEQQHKYGPFKPIKELRKN